MPELKGRLGGNLGRKRGRHRGRWIAGGVVLFLALLLVAGRIALTPLVAHLTRQQLNAQPDMRGDFEGLSLSVLGLSYHLDGLELHMNPPGGTPITSNVGTIDAHVLWRDLLRFHLVAEAVADHIKAVVVIENPEEMKEMTRQIQHLASMHGLGAKLEEQPPFRVQRIELRNFEVLVDDHTEQGVDPKSAEIWAHDMEATLENLADRAELLGGRPTTLALKGKVQRSGDVKLFATADPLADRLDVAAELTLQHLDLRELYGFIAPKTKLQAEGKVDAFVKLRVHDAQLEGSVKPVIENLKILPAEASAKPELEAWLANAGVGLASDRVPGRNGVATVIPIGGSVEKPKFDLWPALLVMLHNAYQAGLPKDFSHEPVAPAGSQPKQGKVAQVTDALTKKRFPAVPAPAPAAGEKKDAK
jgi:hypothetical protein